MGTVIRFPRRHACAPSSAAATAGAGFKNASIGTAPPETSLKRTARLRDASRRPAKRLRRCHSEQSAASAIALTVMPLASAQRSMGCWSDMGPDISPRNDKSQAVIFPVEINGSVPEPIDFGMGKKSGNEQPKIYLGDWLEQFEIGPTEAAEIAGCGQSYISNIIANRKTNINVLYLLRLSDHMHVTINDFYRPLPSRSQLAAFETLSPLARAAILEHQRKKA